MVGWWRLADTRYRCWKRYVRMEWNLWPYIGINTPMMAQRVMRIQIPGLRGFIDIKDFATGVYRSAIAGHVANVGPSGSNANNQRSKLALSPISP